MECVVMVPSGSAALPALPLLFLRFPAGRSTAAGAAPCTRVAAPGRWAGARSPPVGGASIPYEVARAGHHSQTARQAPHAPLLTASFSLQTHPGRPCDATPSSPPCSPMEGPSRAEANLPVPYATGTVIPTVVDEEPPAKYTAQLRMRHVFCPLRSAPALILICSTSAGATDASPLRGTHPARRWVSIVVSGVVPEGRGGGGTLTGAGGSGARRCGALGGWERDGVFAPGCALTTGSACAAALRKAGPSSRLCACLPIFGGHACASWRCVQGSGAAARPRSSSLP